MKRSIFTYTGLALLSMALTFTSCKKDEEEEPAPTKKERLTSNNWVITAYNIEPAIDTDNDGTQENNLIPYLSACDLDDFTDYNADNSYTIEEGPSKCDPNDTQVYETGTWTFNSDETRIIHTSLTAGNYEYKLVSVSTSTLVVERVVVTNGVTYTQTFTFN